MNGMMGTQSFSDIKDGMLGSSGYGGAPTFDALNGGGMDVMGSLRKHSNFATQYMGRPMAGAGAMSNPMSGGFGMGF